MREIRAQFELTEKGVAVDRRYVIVVGDGIHSERFVLGPKDQFSRPEWEFLVGPSVTSCSWHSNNGEGMYVTVYRQYVNPNFDFTPDAYRKEEWLLSLPDVSHFRLYNPFLARPFLQFAQSGDSGWHGEEFPFSEGDQKQFAWSFNDWETKIDEKDVQYTVKRLNDSDDYKEFLIRLD